METILGPKCLEFGTVLVSDKGMFLTRPIYCTISINLSVTHHRATKGLFVTPIPIGYFLPEFAPYWLKMVVLAPVAHHHEFHSNTAKIAR
jgi:hypothetical protein